MLRTTLGLVPPAALLAAVLLGRPGGPPAAAQPPAKAALPADLALVPADAVGFAHVRLADVWKSDLFAQLRKTWLAAGDDTLRALDEQFVPAPSSLDRATVFLLPGPDRKDPRVFGVVAFSAPFDRDKLVKAYLAGARTRQASGKTVYTPRGNADLAVVVPDDRHVLLGADEVMDGYLAKAPAADGPLAGALKLAATRPVVVAANLAALPVRPDELAGALRGLPVDVRPALRAETVVASLGLGADARLEVTAAYPDEPAARAAEDAVRGLVAEGRKALAGTRAELEREVRGKDVKAPRPPDQLPRAVAAAFGVGALNRLDGVLADPKLVTRTGREVALATAVPTESVALAALLGPPLLGFSGVGGLAAPLRGLEDVFGGADLRSRNHLKQIGLAIHSYHDFNGKFPADIRDKTGQAILSWRVAILPYVEEGQLYNQFKLDEPWDSPHNRPLSQRAVKVYESPNVKARTGTVKKGEHPFAQTDYVGVSGPGTMFDPTRARLTFADVADGLSNTVMVVETADPVPWARPGDLVVDPKRPLPKLGAAGMDGLTNMLLGDGSVRRVDVRKVSEQTLRYAFTRNDGQPLGKDWYD